LPARYQVPHVGLLYISFLLLLVFAIFHFRAKVKKEYLRYFLYLLFISMIPAAISVDDFPNLHRAVFMIVPLIFFIALGILNFLESLRSMKRITRIFFISIFSLFFFVELVYAYHQYFSLAGKINSFYRTDGNMEMAKWLVTNKEKYQKVVIPNVNWLSMYYLFVTKDFSPSLIGKIQSNFQIKTLANVQFVQNYCPSSKEFISTHAYIGTVVIIEGNCGMADYYKNFEKLGAISRTDGTAAYRILQMTSLPAGMQ
jgi:hypothetical protein